MKGSEAVDCSLLTLYLFLSSPSDYKSGLLNTICSLCSWLLSLRAIALCVTMLKIAIVSLDYSLNWTQVHHRASCTHSFIPKSSLPYCSRSSCCEVKVRRKNIVKRIHQLWPRIEPQTLELLGHKSIRYTINCKSITLENYPIIYFNKD